MPSLYPKLECSIKVMHRREAKNDPKIMKIYFPDFSDNSREKQIFVNFWSLLAILRCITFMVDPNLGQNEGILKAFQAKMPSFCSKLESFIKVMHRRKAKNDQKFTKICFSRDLSLKSGKINFHEFWTIFGHSTVHHLKKTPKNIRKMDLRKKPHFS